MLGIACAALGAHVLLTDIAVVVGDLCRRNIERNSRARRDDDDAAYDERAFLRDGRVVGDVFEVFFLVLVLIWCFDLVFFVYK